MAFTACACLTLANPMHAGAAEISAQRNNGNRLTYLNNPSDPFYPSGSFPRLTTPQWIGEPGVEAVVILGIDDMLEPAKYETFLRPILNRLKQIDGRAPLSIMTRKVNPADPQLRAWLEEGLSIEVHTLNHPCPLLAAGNFEAARDQVYGCIDLLNQIPNNKPVAFRMPCCDSINSLSPRFFSEIFNYPTPNGHFLEIDSSVFNITTINDPSLPRDWTLDADGRDKFRKYLPFPAYSATIDDYPYPYVIGGTCWEFPCAVPSDWEAQNVQKTNNPVTVADWKTLVDIVVRKQGVFNLVFHPHGWIRNDQIVELIDYAASKHGKKVKFLSFKEAAERLRQNLLVGQPLRGENGGDNGVRLLDVNDDGYVDVVIGNETLRKTRMWDHNQRKWNESAFPVPLVSKDEKGARQNTGVCFGILKQNGFASMLVRTEALADAWLYDGSQWVEDQSLLNGLEENGQAVFTRQAGAGRGVLLRDVNKDGVCEVIVANETQHAIFSWNQTIKSWQKLPYTLPDGIMVADSEGQDAGLRFVDLNGDGYEDLVYSNPKVFSVHLFNSEEFFHLPPGWSTAVKSGKRGDPGEIPMIVRGGPHPNNGAWFRHEYLWVQNEDTDRMTNIVDRRSYRELIALNAEPARSPRDSLACLKPRAGFKAELVACEPLIESPVAFEWGADGKLWVVEMIDYPTGVGGKGASKVRFLEDTNRDGIYDKSTVFLDGLSFPNGIYPWKKGVLISDPPDILYAEDTDGDGKADVKKVLFTGFTPGNPQHRANGYDYGLDNWLYGANGESGGRVTSKATGKVVGINGRDFRFRPDTGEFESESGMTQFGRHRDDWGNWFGNNNPEWLWHFIYPERYLVRNPYLPIPENKRILANYPDSKRVFAISKPMERFNDPIGAENVTSGNSPSPYRDELFGAGFETTVFASEPVHNLVHREVLEPDGVTFRSHRANDEKESEFLASTDNWFRPTMTKTGPDGALYVADMYRLVIEHPEWIPADRQKVIDMRAGADKGRIYRVYPENTTLRTTPNLSRMTTTELIAALDSPNGWQRDTAQRLLVTAQDKAAVLPLQELVRQATRPKTRLQALCTLEGLHAATLPLLIGAIQDRDAHVREHAVRISESFGKEICQLLAEHKCPDFEKLVEDPDMRVRFQLAFTLGQWQQSQAGLLLARIALKDRSDSHMQTAVLSSASPHVGTMLKVILDGQATVPSSGIPERLCSLAVNMNDARAIAIAINAAVNPVDQHPDEWQFNVMAAILDTLDRKNQSFGEFLEKQNLTPNQLGSVQNLFDQARAIAPNPAEKLEVRIAAVRLVGRDRSENETELELLSALLLPQVEPDLQTAALRNLKQHKQISVANDLLLNWKSYSPGLREQVLAVLLSRGEWIEALLKQIENQNIPAGQIALSHQQTLRKHSDESIRERAAKVFTSHRDRQKLVKDYEIVARLKGDHEKGHTVFRLNCMPCHRVKEEGNNVGPDLATVSDKPVPVFLIAILDPNQAVEDRYLNYNVVTRDDREISGIVTTETANSITLTTVGGTRETILRTDLKEMKSSGVSLMPEGFENAIKPQDMADLISYLQSK